MRNYTYDNAGNRTSKKTYAYTTGTLGTATATQTLTYSTGAWGDQLTGTTYDAVGNPLTYNGFAMTWSGRQLKSMVKNGGQYSYSFTYNDEGIRTSKTSQGVKHTYMLEGSRIIGEQFGVHLLLYLYDESGAPVGLQYRKTSYAAGDFDTYYFEKNVFGDIVGIYTADGTKIGTYKYDAWGNCTRTAASGTTALQKQIFNTYNPFRYRGYYYDVETQLYYLQSRYYDPATGRFISPDGYVNANGDLVGFNMYAYCSNNPVMYTDSTGESFWSDLWDGIKSFFSDTFGAATYASEDYKQMQASTLFGGVESGASATAVLSGDNSKPITFYFQTTSDWWEFWEYKVGVNVNIGEGGFNIGLGVGEATITGCINHKSLEIIGGIAKVGFTFREEVDFQNRTAGSYFHMYARPWTIALAVAVVYVTKGAALPALVPSGG